MINTGGLRGDYDVYASIDEGSPYESGPGLLRARLMRGQEPQPPWRRVAAFHALSVSAWARLEG